MSEKYKRIGWIIKARLERKLPWSVMSHTFSISKDDAIFEYARSSARAAVEAFKYDRSMGLVRCVKVYVEVQDAKED